MSDATPFKPSGEPPLPVIDLRDARLAAFLAWLVPGLGHLYQRRTGKGLLFMICILGTFAYGLHLSQGRAVYAATTAPLKNASKRSQMLYFAGQMGVGMPAIVAYIQTWRVESGLQPMFRDDFLRPPYTHHDANRLFDDTLSDDQKNERFFQSRDKFDNMVYHPTEKDKWNYDLGFRLLVGTTYTLIAGLLNLLAICDARWGPFAAAPAEEEPDEKKSAKEKSKESKSTS